MKVITYWNGDYQPAIINLSLINLIPYILEVRWITLAPTNSSSTFLMNTHPSSVSFFPQKIHSVLYPTLSLKWIYVRRILLVIFELRYVFSYFFPLFLLHFLVKESIGFEFFMFSTKIMIWNLFYSVLHIDLIHSEHMFLISFYENSQYFLSNSLHWSICSGFLIS